MAKGKPYTPEEDSYIRKNYERLGPTVIADVLGRSKVAIFQRMQLLKTRKEGSPEAGLTIDEVLSLSRAAGMSYGKYVLEMRLYDGD